MTQEEFNVVFELQMRKCTDILAHKKKEYTDDNIDRLSAFKIAAALQNCDPKAAWQQKDWYANFHRLTPVTVVRSMPLSAT